MDSRNYSLAFKNFLFSRFIDARFQRFVDYYTDRLINQRGMDLESSTNAVLKSKHSLQKTPGESSSKRIHGGYVDTANFQSSTSDHAHEFYQNFSYLPEPDTNLAYCGPDYYAKLKSVERLKSILCRKSSHQTQINHNENWDSSQTIESGAKVKRVKFCKVRKERLFYADSRHRDFKSDISRESSPASCSSKRTTVSIDEVIKSKLITPLLSKYQQLLIADIRQDLEIMDQIRLLPQKAKSVHNSLRSRMGDPEIEFVIRNDVTDPTIHKVHGFYLNKQRQIISIIEDLTNLPQNIAKLCKLFGCSNEAIIYIINTIRSNLVDKVVLQLELMDWDNLNEVISIKDAIDLLQSAILDSH